MKIDESVKQEIFDDLNRYFSAENIPARLHTFYVDFLRRANCIIQPNDYKSTYIELQKLDFDRKDNQDVLVANLARQIKTKVGLSDNQLNNIIKFFSQAITHRYLAEFLETEMLDIFNAPGTFSEQRKNIYHARLLPDNKAVISNIFIIPSIKVIRDKNGKTVIDHLYCDSKKHNRAKFQFVVNLETGNVEEILSLSMPDFNKYYTIAPSKLIIMMSALCNMFLKLVTYFMNAQIQLVNLLFNTNLPLFFTNKNSDKVMKKIRNKNNQTVANILKTSGMGNNCLFRSVAHYTANQDFTSNNAEAARLRQAACDYISTMDFSSDDVELLKFSRSDIKFNNINEYTRLMRGSKQGGELEIKALSEILNRDIVVLRKSSKGKYTVETHGPYVQGQRLADGSFPSTNVRSRPADGPPILVEYNGRSHYSRVQLSHGVTAEQAIAEIKAKNAKPQVSESVSPEFIEQKMKEHVQYQQLHAPELRLLQDYYDQEKSRQWCEASGNTLAVISRPS